MNYEQEFKLEVVGFKLNEQHLCEPFPFRKIPKLVFWCCVCSWSRESSLKSSCQATLQIHMKTITQWSTPGISHCAHFLHIWKLGLLPKFLTGSSPGIMGLYLACSQYIQRSLYFEPLDEVPLCFGECMSSRFLLISFQIGHFS